MAFPQLNANDPNYDPSFMSPTEAHGEGETVLVVDDEPIVCSVISQFLRRGGYSPVIAHTPEDCRTLLANRSPEALILDFHLSDEDGIDLIRGLTNLYPDTVLLVISGQTSLEFAVEALRAGATDFLPKPIHFNRMLRALQGGLKKRAARIEQIQARHALELLLEVKNRDLQASLNTLERRTTELSRAYQDLLARLGRASQFRDDETGLHIQRIGLFSAVVARQLGLTEENVQLIADAAPMHDIGKIGVPDHILLKRGSLTEAEREHMKSHTLIGAELFSGSDLPILRASEDIAISHHEWWNGSGYPQGLRGEEIPLFGRIVAVVDVYDALMHERPYKAALTVEQTMEIIRNRRGTQFDPKVFDAFLTVEPKLRQLEGSLALLTPVPSRHADQIGLMRTFKASDLPLIENP